MTKHRLLIYLGYDINTPIVGRAEAVDPKSMMRLTSPRRRAEQPKAAADAMKAEPKAEEMNNDEAGDDQPKTKTGKKAAPKKKAADDEGSGDEPK